MLLGEETLLGRYNQASTLHHQFGTPEHALASRLKATLRQRMSAFNIKNRTCFASLLPDPRIIGRPSNLHLYICSFLTTWSGWHTIGPLHSFVFEEMARKHPFTHFQWGATYNTRNIRPVTINIWNRGVRVHIDGAYLQLDNGKSLSMGSAMMTRGTDDAATKATKKADGSAEFLQHYVSATGKKQYGSNKNSFGMYVRKLARPWIRLGLFVTNKDFKEYTEKYPHSEWEWGTDYNRHTIKPLTVTSWNRGYRIHVTTPYMQKDSVDVMCLGTSVWTHNTNDAESKNAEDKFYHRYYQCQNDHRYIAGASNRTQGFVLFVRRM